MPDRIADVLVPLALDTAYSYRVPDQVALAEGDVVTVPLGPRETVGVVWGLREGAAANLKPVTGRVDAVRLEAPLRRFLDWLAWYTLAPRGSVLAMALKLPAPRGAERPRVGVRLAGDAPERVTPARARVLATASDGLVRGKRDLALAAGVSASVVDGLIDEGTLEVVEVPPAAMIERPDPDHAPARLSAEQAAAASRLVRTVAAGGASVTLLDGVTGSGKTEVYFEAVAEALRRGRQALILMPEIALTAPFLERFEARFGARPAAWHSGVSGRRREATYAGVASGEVRVVIGARSSLFLPFRELGLIVVDEEHEAGYKQEDGVLYNARDMAVVRAKIEEAALVLASATPSLETRVNVERGRFGALHLTRRFGERRLPTITTVDLRRNPPPPGRWLAPPLDHAIEAALAAREQVLLFLNRRGYAPLTLCRACGHRLECPNCSAWLVEHRFRRMLMCHHCGHGERRPDACPSCGAFESLVPCGPGVERITEEVATLFPEARRITLSSDFPGGTERLRRELAGIAAGEADIVVGTQLVAKGHNFPNMTLVGILDADIGLTSGDPRAAERSFQLLQQVSGRAGRGAKPGRAFVQTWQPDHPVIAALVSGDAERFYAEEARGRSLAELPPYGRLAALIVSASDKERAQVHARELARVATAPEGIVVLGPAEAPIALVAGRYRFRLLVKARREADLQRFLREWLGRGPKLRGDLKVAVDVDPQSFL